MNAGRVAAVLEACVADGDAVGAVAIAVADGGVLCHETAGWLDRETGVAMVPDAIFQIASMTKAVTSVAAMQLVERGLLELDTPVAVHLPALADAPVLAGYDAAGEPQLRPAARPITLRHLLTHTSGFAYTTWDATLFEYRRRHPGARPIEAPELRLSAPLIGDPGACWRYSVSTDWLGLAVAAASGLALDAYFAEHIFAPLGMLDTGYVVPGHKRDRVAARYLREPDGGLRREPPASGAPPFMGGGGGLYATAADYARLLAALLSLRAAPGGDCPLLRPETVLEMGRNQIGALPAGRLLSSEPHRSHDVDFYPGGTAGWGLGFLINPESVAGGRSAGSLSWGGIYNTYYWLDPAARVAGAVFTQVLPFADPRILARYAAFERCVYG